MQNSGEAGEVLSTVETITKILKEGKEKGISLEAAKDAFEELEKEILLMATEKNQLEKIKHAITNPNDYKDKTPSTALDKPGLQKLLGDAITVDDTLLGKFTVIDTKTLSFESVKKILDLVGANHESKNDDKFNAFIAHLEHNHKDITGADHNER